MFEPRFTGIGPASTLRVSSRHAQQELGVKSSVPPSKGTVDSDPTLFTLCPSPTWFDDSVGKTEPSRDRAVSSQ